MTEDPRQTAYREARRLWVEDPENGLVPYPQRDRIKPEPGELDTGDEQEG